jgi:DNA polymerase I-like protein with 3'-5' exonuclease and polymerase domains
MRVDKAQLVLQVHDEFVVEVEGDEAVVLANVLQNDGGGSVRLQIAIM